MQLNLKSSGIEGKVSWLKLKSFSANVFLIFAQNRDCGHTLEPPILIFFFVK